MGKKYYIAVERYDTGGNKISRRYVNGRAFGALYSFTSDVNDAKYFGNLKAAKEYMKNYIGPSREKVFYEIMYDIV